MENVNKKRTGLKVGAIALIFCAFTLGGCNRFVPAERLSMSEQIKTDKQTIVQNATPITAPLSVEEAVARALKYNLDRRVKEMEVNLASGQYKAALLQTLPKVNAQADYSTRSNDRVTLNRDGTPNSIAQDRTHTVSEFGASWNLLEFGLGYFNAKQAGERIQIAEERRRKAVYALIQDVRSAYWRSACAQVMRDRLKENIKLAEEALETAQKVESQKLRSPQDELAYQRQLLENLRMLEAVQQELSTAQVELSSLIGAPVGQPFELKFELPKASDTLLEFPVEKLEELALENNADLRESHHQSQIARIETRKILAQLFPSLSFNVSTKYDTDSFQANQRWNEAGVHLSYNLLNLLAAPTQIELGKVGVELANQRRVVTQMAVLTQLHVARLNLINSGKQLSRASKIRELDRRLATLSASREKVGTRGKLETISTNTTALLSEFRSYQAIAQSQVAESRLSAVVGLEFYANNMNTIELSDLVSEIAKSPDEIVRKIQSLEQKELEQAPAVEPRPQDINPAIEPVVTAPQKVEPVVEHQAPQEPKHTVDVSPVVASESQLVQAAPAKVDAVPAVVEQTATEQAKPVVAAEVQVANPEVVKAEVKSEVTEAQPPADLIQLQAQIEAETKVDVAQTEGQVDQVYQNKKELAAKKLTEDGVELSPLSVERLEATISMDQKKDQK